MEKKYGFTDFLNIIKLLRSENGCPWDKVQTHESLREAMLEEAYEVVEAINNKDIANLKEELGDVLLQLVFHADIERDAGNFNMDDVIDGISRKMILRHPHIFADAKADTPEDVLFNWDNIKKKEKGQKTQTAVLKAVPDALPALTKARKVQKKAADVGFDFACAQDTINKVEEEWHEFLDAQNGTKEQMEEEFGDILFSLVNVARFLNINPEFALTKAVKKFINRFEYVEESTLSEGKQFSRMTLLELDLLWKDAKYALAPNETALHMNKEDKT